MFLNELKQDECGVICGFDAFTQQQKYLTELGFFNGQIVSIVVNLSDSKYVICKIRNYKIAISYTDASMIPIIKQETNNAKKPCNLKCHDCDGCSFVHTTDENILGTINIALVGNPNCGKTTLFNFLAKTNEHVGNYAGVTVDFKKASFIFNGYKFNITDLPGVYSLNSEKPDERCTSQYISNKNIDIIVNVLDSTKLERSLYLTTQLQHYNKKVICAFNFYDKFIENGFNISLDKFKDISCLEGVNIISATGFGVHSLFQRIMDLYTNDAYTMQYCTTPNTERTSIEENYQYVDKILENIDYSRGYQRSYETMCVLDKLFLNRYYGWGCFLSFTSLMFFTTFYIGKLPTYIFDIIINKAASIITLCIPISWLKSLLVDGVLQAVGIALTFIPQIFILYCFINFFEESGYASRVVLLIDRFMRRIGLHGRSFIPLISGLGCNVPAILLTKGIADTKNRIITTMAIPMISCPAKLPVYIMLVCLFFNNTLQGVIIFSIYFFGFLLTILVSKVLNMFFKDNNNDYIIEIQEYKIPKMQYVFKYSFNKCKHFLKNIGTIIVATSAIFWCLEYFPHHDDISHTQQLEQSYIGQIGKKIEPFLKPLGFSWKLSVSLLSGICAKETIAPTIALLYKNGTTNDIKSNMSEEGVNKIVVIAFLIFVLLYFPCLGTLAAINKLYGIKWMLLSLLLNTCLAYISAFVVSHIATMVFT